MLKKISHISLVVLMLFSTVGMSISLHFCKDTLYDIGIYSEAKNCCIPQDKGIIHHHCSSEGHDKDVNHHENHCEDETIKFEPVNDFIISAFGFNFELLSFSKLFILNTVCINLFELSDIFVFEVSARNISPPKIQVVLSLLQTYLR